MVESETAAPRSPEGAADPRAMLRKIVFVCYGPFDCNSAGHMAGFANALAGMG
jgi:hypothetical protein